MQAKQLTQREEGASRLNKAPAGATWVRGEERLPEWAPRTKTEAQGLILDRKALLRLSPAHQALVSAFAVNQFPGGKWKCARSEEGEAVTRGHIARCPGILREARLSIWRARLGTSRASWPPWKPPASARRRNRAKRRGPGISPP